MNLQPSEYFNKLYFILFVWDILFLLYVAFSLQVTCIGKDSLLYYKNNYYCISFNETEQLTLNPSLYTRPYLPLFIFMCLMYFIYEIYVYRQKNTVVEGLLV